LSAKLPSFKWYLFGNESLYSALKLNYLQIQLRFCFITDIDAEEQKDCCPEHLCIDVNGQKLYSYSEVSFEINPIYKSNVNHLNRMKK
jgi:hypothetical protein